MSGQGHGAQVGRSACPAISSRSIKAATSGLVVEVREGRLEPGAGDGRLSRVGRVQPGQGAQDPIFQGATDSSSTRIVHADRPEDRPGPPEAASEAR